MKAITAIMHYNKKIWIGLLAELLILALVALLFAACQDEEKGWSAPVVTRVTPAAAGAGETVVVSGRGFQRTAADNIVAFNGTLGVVTAVEGDTLLRVEVPQQVTSGPVSVANRFAAGTGPFFTALENPHPPVLESLSVPSAESGENIVLYGRNFHATEPYRNVVMIGGRMATVTSATETELRTSVPLRTAGGRQDVTVTVTGARSNAVSLEIVPVPLVIRWFSNTQLNLPDNLVQYGASFATDGTYTATRLPDDGTEAGLLKYPVSSPLYAASPSAYDASQDMLYLANTFEMLLQQVGRNAQAEDFSTLYDASSGIDLSSVTALALHPPTGDLLVAAYNGAEGAYALYKAALDGSGITLLAPNVGGPVNNITCSDQYIYVQENAPSSGVAPGVLRRVPVSGGAAETVDLSSLPPWRRGIRFAMFSRREGNLYFLYDPKSQSPDGNWATPAYLYKMNEGTGVITEVGSAFPYNTADMKLIDTATGTYMFALEQESSPTTTWWDYRFHLLMLNLRSGGAPQRIYSNMHIIPGDPNTIFSPEYDKQYYAHTIFIDQD